jgi:tungstate transport system ATP-binding protein
MVFIETIDLWQRREKRDILKGVNLRIERGEVFALIGPTGAGKTTLLRLINLLDAPSVGKIIFDGTNATSSEKVRLEMRRRMAFVLQKPVVFNASVFDNVAFGLKWRGVRRRQVAEKVEYILEMTGLKEYKKRNARTLSGGEVQRVAIARAVAVGPEVLLLDEPTANLDPISASKIEDLIVEIIKQNDITVIMATHDMSQGQRLADRMGVLVNGEIVQTGKAKDIFQSPRNREIAEFVGMENVIDGVVVSCKREISVIGVKGTFIEAVADCTIGENVSICIRAEDVTVALSKLSSSARNSLAGVVTWTAIDGPFCRVEIDCGFPLVALVTRKSADELELKRGMQVYATFKAVNIHVIRQH